MDVILLERVAKLGQMGDVVSVKEGYARNFLLPQKKALRASKTNIDALVFNNQYVAWMSECCLYAPNSATVVGRGAARPVERSAVARRLHLRVLIGWPVSVSNATTRTNRHVQKHCSTPKSQEIFHDTLL